MKKTHKERPASRKAKIIGCAVGLLLAWPTLQLSLALAHSADEDLAAADFAEDSQSAATAAAQQRLADGDPAGAETLARNALAVSPISDASLRVLALAEQQQGNWQHSNALMNQAAALGWRDLPTQLWLAAAYVQAKDYENAANRLDAALRVNPDLPQLHALIDSSAADPQLRPYLLRRLALNPAWRQSYFADPTLASPDAARARGSLLAGLSGTANPPSHDELVQVLSAMVSAGAAGEARNLWIAANHGANQPLYDGRFERTAQSYASPFEWSLRSVPGAETSAEKRDNAPGDALLVRTDGTASGTLARQWLRLTPGEHQLTVSSAGPASSLRSLAWTIRCMPHGPTITTLQGSGKRDTAAFATAPDCTDQVIELQARPQAGSSNGEVRFFDMVIN
ncbi:hypothetical protein [Sphingomonas oryzagri]|uniref:Tetratricopeptide repeat protein n=1 Tax=Sphingomonas oryzagri TaxID=3042314 RepID=A0ABT6MXR8_9SPHN|nr:hypothetical protein [Sphingomonas oryzagri]MDH7637279.1 hypothetical protein [Sphingomonas oryzagri]